MAGSDVYRGHGLTYAGDRDIVDRSGVMLAEGVAHQEGVVIAAVDPDRVVEVRDAFRFLSDRKG